MDFSKALQFVFQKEGGLSSDPVDRGGITNFGISQRSHPGIDVAKLSQDQAAALYKSEYWDAIGADSLPPEMRLTAFDAAVQHGPGTARQLIESSGGDTNKLLQLRSNLYRKIVENDPSQAKFTNGWNSRLASVAASTSDTGTDAQKALISSQVADMKSKKLGDEYVLSKLADAGLKGEVEHAKAQGFSPAEIVSMRIPRHCGHDSTLMADRVPRSSRTAFRVDGGQHSKLKADTLAVF